MLYQDWLSKRRLVGCAVFASLAAGCAHGSKTERELAEAKTVEKLESRVKSLEKTKGRLSVRLDEMEDEVFLLQDRVEAHRLALKRRGFMEERTGNRARAEAPEPTPETNYGGQRQKRKGEKRYEIRGKGGHSPSEKRQAARERRGTRIPLDHQSSPSRDSSSDESTSTSEGTSSERQHEKPRARARAAGEHAEEQSGKDGVVITQKDFQKFAKSVEDESQNSNKTGGDDGASTSSSGGEAKRRVTDETLPTEDDGPSNKTESSPDAKTDDSEPNAPAPDLEQSELSEKSGLELYKASLAKYRSGEFATALEGFERFLSNGPRDDYRDNGLYWIGECHYGLGKFRKAVKHFQRVLDEEPDGNKVPDAMLKMALAYRELEMDDRARRTLETLTERYPSTNAGRLGEKKLSELNS